LSQKYFRPDNRVVVVNGPKNESSTLPSEVEILKDTGMKQQTGMFPPISTRWRGQNYCQEVPAAGTISSEKLIPEVEVTELELSNGAKVILKPTDFKNDEISMTAWSQGGSSLYPDEDYQSAANADAIVNECGVGSYSPTDLQKILAGKTANVRPFIATLSEGSEWKLRP
jgi:zinc protease